MRSNVLWCALTFMGFLCGAAGALAAESAKTPSPSANASPTAAPPVKIKRTEIIAADNWTVTCTVLDQPNAKRRCSAELRIAQTENNAPRVVFTWIVALQDGKPTSVISAPSGVLIGPGVKMKVGDKEERTLNYSLCQPDHCEAIAPLDESTVKALQAATTTDFTVVAVNGSAVKFTATLNGFNEAFALVTKP